MKKVAFKTLGCKVNTYETEAMKNQFIANDYKVVDFDDKADVYVINTCTVTNQADSKSRQAIRKAIKQNSEAIVAAVGCYTQVSADEAAQIEGLDIILGNKNKNKIVNIIESNKRFVHTDDIFEDDKFEDLKVDDFTENTRAFLKIQDGCNKFCSYCKIPYARGKMRSRDAADILRAIQDFVDKGYNEVVLTGIHTAGYGQDLDNYKFEDLLEDILNNVEGLKRLRISSIEATYITDKIIKMLKEEKRMVKHLHIPIQSASNKVLKDMRRNYSVEEFKNIVDNIRKEIPGVSITTDIIVGYPTETDEDFKESLKNVKEINFNELHVFPFSKRDGTQAAILKELNGKIVDQRVNEMIELSNDLANKYASNFEGKTMEVLFEANNVGFTDNYLRVKVDSKNDLTNKIVNVKIIKTGFPENFGGIEND